MIRIALAAAALAVATPVMADWPDKFYSYDDGAYHSARRRGYLKRQYYDPPRETYRDRYYDGTRVRAWIQRDGADDYSHEMARTCYDPVKVVGEPGHSIERARNNAIAAFSSHVVWKFGQQAMSVDWARNVRFSCSQSSIPQTGGTARAIDAAAEKFGKTTDELRCELTAVPCRAPVGEQVK